jgi:hypothetical protein
VLDLRNAAQAFAQGNRVALIQQVQAQFANFEMVGQVLLGMPPEVFF